MTRRVPAVLLVWLVLSFGKETSPVSLFNGKDLAGWQVSQFGTQGDAYVHDGQILLTWADGCSGITWGGDFPRNDYEVSLDAKRIRGNDFFCSITFPIDSTFCTLIVGGWGNLIVGLSNVDGEDASRNQTNALGVFENNRWYHVRLKVSGTKIGAWIDGEKLVDFDSKGHEIDIRSTMEVATPFGISAWESIAAIKNIRLKKL